MVMAIKRKPIGGHGLINYRLPENMGYTMWIKGTEWKMNYYKNKEKRRKNM